jgi:hypothetical protein
VWVSLTMVSANRKTGPIPVSITETASCPKTCPMLGTDCYANTGPLLWHWEKVKEGGRGDNWTEFCRRIAKFVKGQLFRHNQAGDLPKDETLSKRGVDRLDAKKCKELSNACNHINGWTYTHYDVTDRHNRKIIKEMNKSPGMTVNLSADSLDQADALYDLNVGPVCVTLPEDVPNMGNKTPNGVTIVICPAQTQENMDCKRCKLCTIGKRKSIVGFKAHGKSHKRLSIRLKGESSLP